MRKNTTSSVRCFLIGTMLVLIQLFGWSQVSDPSSWSMFVTGDENPLLTDTFRMQTFNDLATDNWTYTAVGQVELFDPSTVPFLSDASDGMAIRLLPEGEIIFDDYPLSIYRDIMIQAAYAAVHVNKGMILYLSIRREEPVTNLIYVEPEKDYSVTFREKKTLGGWNSPKILIGKDPWGFSLSAGKPSVPCEGYYALDSVFVHGEIPRYSLFTGSGVWDEEARWSHLPADRHREALVHGDLTIDREVHCRSIHLYDCNLRFSSSGTLDLEDSFFVHYTFPEKGKWYFFSFPFDVYPEDIDPELEWKDDTPNDGGNYFYLCRYDGWRRAERQEASGNWDVLSPSSLPLGQPLFEKDKGYLIALDEKANKQTFFFKGRGGQLPADFGRNASIAVTVSPYAANFSPLHQGWQLCGNPFPSELRLSDIVPNPALDGFIYVLEDMEYKAYAIGSSFAIPPYSAFFVKAKQDTKIRMTASEPATRYKTIACSPLSDLRADRPTKEPLSPAGILVGEQGKLRFRIKGAILYVENMPVVGKVHIYDLFGRICKSVNVPAGSSQHPVSLPKGFYSISITPGSTSSDNLIPVSGIHYIH